MWLGGLCCQGLSIFARVPKKFLSSFNLQSYTIPSLQIYILNTTFYIVLDLEIFPLRDINKIHAIHTILNRFLSAFFPRNVAQKTAC